MDNWKTTFLLGRPMFRWYVSFREGTPQFGSWILEIRQQLQKLQQIVGGRQKKTRIWGQVYWESTKAESAILKTQEKYQHKSLPGSRFLLKNDGSFWMMINLYYKTNGIFFNQPINKNWWPRTSGQLYFWWTWVPLISAGSDPQTADSIWGRFFYQKAYLEDHPS